jgi:hypothetical protein
MTVGEEESKLMTKMPVCFRPTLTPIVLYCRVGEAEAGEEGDEEEATAVVLVSTIAIRRLPGGRRS